MKPCDPVRHRVLVLCATAITVASSLCCTAFAVHAADAVVALGGARHLFIDNALVASSRGVTRTMNPPMLSGPVAGLGPGPEGSYNDAYCSGGTIVKDGDTYKGWFGGWSAEEMLKTSGEKVYPTGYYTSKDGLTWTAPKLGLFEWKGSKANNIVSLGGGLIFLDPKSRSESERFKMLVGDRSGGAWNDPKTGGLYFSTSPDGIHWKFNPQRVLPRIPDGGNQVIYDARIGKYVVYLRCWPTPPAMRHFGTEGGRAVCRLELNTPPMTPWPVPKITNPYHIWGKDKIATVSTEYPVVMTHPTTKKFNADGTIVPAPEVDVYDPGVHLYPDVPDVYFAFPEFNHRIDPKVNLSWLDISMCVSRDGIHWNWPSEKPYIPAPKPGEGVTTLCNGMIFEGDKIYQYYFSTRIAHRGDRAKVYTAKDLLGSGRIYRAVQRRDGFVSQDFSSAGGELLTKPFTFQGKSLALNVNAADGSGKVALCDAAGKEIAGFTLADCDDIKSDAVNHPVTWKQNADVAKLAGTPVRLRFKMQGAKLYAFQFVPGR